MVELDGLTANEQLDGKPVRVLRLKTAAEARACAIAYISASEGTRAKNDLDALRGQNLPGSAGREATAQGEVEDAQRRLHLSQCVGL